MTAESSCVGCFSMSKYCHRYYFTSAENMEWGGRMIRNAIETSRKQNILNMAREFDGGVNTGVSVLQFKIQLRHTPAPVWRRVLVPDDWSFAGLHAVIQAAFEWDDKNPHNFVFGGKVRIESQNELEMMSDTKNNVELRSEQMARLTDIFSQFERGVYTYDFEENWEHDVVFERVLPKEPTVIYPCCIKARGSAPADESFELIEPDLDEINIRLALLLPEYRRYQYTNPYEWRLYSCLTRQKMLVLRAVGRLHKTRNWSRLNKEDLITSLTADIIASVYDFMHVEENESISDHQLLCYLIANHESDIPFELERYQECLKNREDIIKIVDELKVRGYVYELADLDRKQMPVPMRQTPEDFYPVLVMPAEVRQRCLQVIEDEDSETRFRKAVCEE